MNPWSIGSSLLLMAVTAQPAELTGKFLSEEGFASPDVIPERVVIVNGKRLSPAELERVERTYRVHILPADYWYDRMTGAWGIRGGPTRGFVLPNVDLGGRLAADASGGGTQVFINGRELHPDDVANLQKCLP
ncbi:MAG TPA: hypothetical protein VFN91_07120, partial [Myxococcaceae bacterium]|nr:hypothetical protein [Myxococcaceae bacterium]